MSYKFVLYKYIYIYMSYKLVLLRYYRPSGRRRCGLVTAELGAPGLVLFLPSPIHVYPVQHHHDERISIFEFRQWPPAVSNTIYSIIHIKSRRDGFLLYSM